MILQKSFIEMFKLKVPAPILEAQKQQTDPSHWVGSFLFCDMSWFNSSIKKQISCLAVLNFYSQDI